MKKSTVSKRLKIDKILLEEKESDSEAEIKRFQEFENKMGEGVEGGNPVFATKAGNMHMIQNNLRYTPQSPFYSLAKAKYDQAIKEDPVFSIPARMNKANALIQENADREMRYSKT